MQEYLSKMISIGVQLILGGSRAIVMESMAHLQMELQVSFLKESRLILIQAAFGKSLKNIKFPSFIQLRLRFAP